MIDLHQLIMELDRRVTVLEEQLAREQTERQYEERFVDDCIVKIETSTPRQNA